MLVPYLDKSFIAWILILQSTEGKSGTSIVSVPSFILFEARIIGNVPPPSIDSLIYILPFKFVDVQDIVFVLPTCHCSQFWGDVIVIVGAGEVVKFHGEE